MAGRSTKHTNKIKKRKLRSTSTSTASKSPSTAPKKRRSIAPMRQQLKILVDQANERANELLRKENIKSRALVEAQRTLLPSHREKYGELFTYDLPRRRDITRELARVQTFLSDYTSMSEGAEAFTHDLVDRHLFGGDFYKEFGEGYNADVVDKDTAKEVFRIYDELLETYGGWERVSMMFRDKYGISTYGSENLINAIYDMVENNPTHNLEYQTIGGISYEELIKNRLGRMIEEGLAAYEKELELMTSNLDYQTLFKDPDSIARANFFRYRRELRREKRGY